MHKLNLTLQTLLSLGMQMNILPNVQLSFSLCILVKGKFRLREVCCDDGADLLQHGLICKARGNTADQLSHSIGSLLLTPKLFRNFRIIPAP